MIRKVAIGSGRPKICMSLTEKTVEEIVQGASELLEKGADLIEWRVDFFERHPDESAVKGVLRQLRPVLGDTPLLFTFRTAEEGGSAKISVEAYESLNRWAIQSPEADLIDLELFRGKDLGQRLIPLAHAHGKKVLLSNHDFDKTPPRDEVLHRLMQMKTLGADIVKIALMPNDKQDVLTLMEASVAFSEAHSDLPLVTMSMGPLGVISRIAGGFTGSAITFGAGKVASAPGQIPAADLLVLLEKIEMYS